MQTFQKIVFSFFVRFYTLYILIILYYGAIRDERVVQHLANRFFKIVDTHTAVFAIASPQFFVCLFEMEK